jgi:sugar diacid utilization regulator
VLADAAAVLSAGGGLHLAATARRTFRNAILEGAGYAGLAEEAGRLLGAGVAILDEYLDVAATAGLTESEERLLEEAIGRSRGHGPASVIGPFITNEMQDRILHAVEGTPDPIGVLVVWRPPPPDPGQGAILHELSVACALERSRETARTETEARLRGELIEELMAGEAVNRESLVRRARNLGADLSGGAVAILGKLVDPHTDGRVITDMRLVRRFLQQAQATIGLSWPLSLVEWDAGQLLCLLPPTTPGLREAGREEIEEAATTQARRLLAATKETVPGLALTLAVSRFTPHADRLGAALEEARLALSIGERLGRYGEVITFEETGTYKLLFQIFAERPDELSRFYDQTLDPLVRYDEQYQTELVGTLATYLGNDCNLAATASKLFTHRHTVRYRLDRIAELSGLDISKTDDREKLSLGLKSMRLLGKKVQTPGDRERR